MNSRFNSLLAIFLLWASTSDAAAALQVLSATGVAAGTRIGVVFNGPLDPASAATATNYALNGGLTVSEAVLRPDQNSVGLTVSGPLADGATVTVNGVKDTSGNSIAANSSVAVTLSPMRVADIGDVVDAATVTPYPNGEFDILAGGRAIWGTEDKFNFIYETRTGDFDVKVQIASYVSPDNQARAGLMMRESLELGSKNVDLVAYRPERQLWGMTVRAENDGATAQPAAKGASVNPPNSWVRLKRSGGDVTAYFGTNGFNWTDSIKQTIDFPESVLVGLATMATEGATTDRVAVDYKNYGDMVYPGAAINITAQPQPVSTLAGSTATFSITAEAANAPQNELSYQWQRNGTNILGANGASYTTPLLTTADDGGKFRALLKLPGASATSAEVNLTVTQDTSSPTIVAAYALQDGTSIGIALSEPVDPQTANDPSHYTVSGGLTVESATLSADSKSVALTLQGGTVANNTTVTVTGVKDLSGNTVAANTTATLTIVPLRSVEIGDAVPSVVAPVGPDDIDVLAGGRDIWGTDDSFNFVYEEKSGDFDVAVQIERYVPVSNNARASLMVRETLETGSRNVDVILYPINRQLWGVTVRNETFIDTAQPLAEAVPVTLPNAWLRLRRNGSLITAYYGQDGVNWLRSFKVNAVYPDKVLVGLATTSNSNTTDGRIPVSYRNYTNLTYAGSSISITQQPAPASIGAGKTATFTVAAQVTGAPAEELVYQWQKNGTNISGANAASFTTVPLTGADNGAKYKVILSVPGAQAISEEVAVTVTVDNTPPSVASALALGDSSAVTIKFNEPVDAAGAVSANFAASGGASVTDAILSNDGNSIVLTLSNPVAPVTTITINNVKDLSGNTIAANTSAAVTVLPLKVADIGVVNVPSTVVALSGADIDVIAGGQDIWTEADAFNFVYESKSGDFDVEVQITGETMEDATQTISTVARASLMLRESLDAGSRNVDIIVYPVARQLWGVTVRPEPGVATAQPLAVGAPVAFPNVWLRIKRLGSEVTCYYGTDGVDWLQSFKVDPTVSAGYPANVLVGVATVSANNSANGRLEVNYRNLGDFAPPADKLNISSANGQVTITWSGTATLQSADIIPFDWKDVPGATSPFPVATTGPAKFYRLRL